MITVITKLNPAEFEKVEKLPFAPNKKRKLFTFIPKEFRGEATATAQITVNNKEVDVPELYKRTVEDDDTIVIRNVPRFEAMALAHSIVATAGSVIWPGGLAQFRAIMWASAIMYGIGRLILHLTDDEPEELDDSKTYGFNTPKNSTANGTPISIVYGHPRVGGHVLQAKTTLIDNDKVRLDMLFGLTEGGDRGILAICGIEEDSDDISVDTLDEGYMWINKNTASTYSDVTISTRLGTGNQGIIPGFEDTVILNRQLGSVVVKDTPVQVLGQNDVDSIEIKLVFPSGLFRRTAGGFQNKTVSIRYEWKLSGAASYTNSQTETYTNNKAGVYRISNTIPNLNLAVYDIRVVRLTDDDDAEEPTVQSEFQLAEVNEIIYDDIGYVNRAVVAVKALATDQLHGGAPQFNFLVYGIKVRVYTSPGSYEYSWSNNPAWVILDLLLNKHYGLGGKISIDEIDIQSFIDFGAYCDESVSDGQGGTEKRATINIVIDEPRDAWAVLYDIGKSANGTLFSTGGKYTIKPETVASPVMMFTPVNVADFKMGYTSFKDRVNYVNAKIWDEQDEYQQTDVVALDDNITELDTYNKKNVVLPGVTRRSQAIRILNQNINAAKLNIRFAEWTSSIPYMFVTPNDIVEIANHLVYWGLYSGSIVSASAGGFVVDEDITLEAGKTYYIRIWHVGGEFEEKQITSSNGTFEALTINGSWNTIPAKYTGYSIGELDEIVRTMRILDTSTDEEFKTSFKAVEYNADVFNDTIIDLPITVPRVDIDPIRIPAEVEDVTLVERILVDNSGSTRSVVDVYFTPPVDANYAYSDIWVRVAGEVFSNTPAANRVTGTNNTLDIGFEKNTTYEVAITPISSTGQRRAPASVTVYSITIVQNATVPDNVSDFRAEFINPVQLEWGAVTNTNLLGYEIREGANWESGVVLAQTLNSTRFSYEPPHSTIALTLTYQIKAINSSGIYSDTAAQTSVIVLPLPERNVVINTSEQTAWLGTKTNMSLSGDSLAISGTALTGSYETPVKDCGGILRSFVSVNVTGATTDPNATWLNSSFTWESTFGTARTWEGPVNIQSPTAISVKWRAADTTGALSSAAYTDFLPSHQSFRYAQFKLEATRTDLLLDFQFDTCDILIDVPDVVDSATTAIDSAPKTVSFNRTFYTANPATDINITAAVTTNAVSGDYIVIGTITNTDFPVTVKKANGDDVTDRTISWIARGY